LTPPLRKLLGGRRRREEDLDAELQAAFDILVRQYAQSMPLADARRQARLEFGALDPIKENVRRVAVVQAALHTLGQDLRHALRALGRDRGFTAVALLSLALGIGANSAIFTFFNAVLLRPVAARQPAQLIAIYTKAAGGPLLLRNSLPNYRDLCARSRAFAGIAAFTGSGVMVNRGGGGEPEQEHAQLVSDNYFSVLGVPLRGHGFSAGAVDPAGGPGEVVISDRLWGLLYGSGRADLGGVLQVNGQELAIVGVAPPGFSGLNLLAPAEIWLPVRLARRLGVDNFGGFTGSRRMGVFDVVGRLRPGVSREVADAEMRRLGADLAARFPVENRGRTFRLLGPESSAIDPNVRDAYVGGGVVSLLAAGAALAVACANLAGLLIARGAGRRREIAVRLALGATRGRLIRMLLTESLLLALAGSASGLLLALWIRSALWSLRPPTFPPSLQIGIDGRVLLFTLALALATGALFGLAPALQLSRPHLTESLKNASGRPARRGARRPRLGSLLVAAQVAFAMLPLFGAGLFLRSFDDAGRFDPGFRLDQEVVVAFDLATAGDSEPRGEELYRRVAGQVRALPGVAAVALAESLNLHPFGYVMRTVFRAKDHDFARATMVYSNVVTATYFDTLGIPLLEGRLFTDAGGPGELSEVVVNSAMAQRFWPGESAVGKRIYLYGSDEPVAIVGVVRDARYLSLLEERQSCLYLPLAQIFTTPIYVHVRGRPGVDPAALLLLVRKTIRGLAPNVALGSAFTMREVYRRSLWAPRLGAVVLASFAALVLVLVAIGLYGAVSQAVRHQRRELGIRMALGASRWAIMRSVLKVGIVPATAGLAAGAAGSTLIAPAVSRFLFKLSGGDGPVLATAVFVLVAAGWIASLSAAHRTAAIDPVDVIKQE
jgi:predicted permease